MKTEQNAFPQGGVGQSEKAQIRRKLRELSRPFITATEEFASAAEEIRGGPDRTACIVVTSLITRVLELVIIARLMIVGKKKIDPLFERDGALSTFYGNIHLAFALDVINQVVRDDLDIIRRVRNQFAHSVLPLTFQTPEISLEIHKLKYKSYYSPSTEEQADLEAFAPPGERREFLTCCHAIGKIVTVSALNHQRSILYRQEAIISALRKRQRDQDR